MTLTFNSHNLGGIGRDNLPGHNTEDLDAFKIYSVMAQTSRAINKSNIVSESAAPTGHPEPSAQILRCFVHERVIRYESSMVSVIYCLEYSLLSYTVLQLARLCFHATLNILLHLKATYLISLSASIHVCDLVHGSS